MRILEHDMYFQIVDLLSKRSTCLRRGVGAIIVKEGRILSTGWNGSPTSTEHCIDMGYCLRQELNVPSGEKAELCRAVHAEQNAIIFAAKHGISIDGAILYTNTFPCVICAKMIINSGIKDIYYKNDYNDALSKEILKGSRVMVHRYKEDGTLETLFSGE